MDCKRLIVEKIQARIQKTAANIDLPKMLPESVDKETVHTWHYKHNPAVETANLECKSRVIGIDYSSKIEEKNNITLGNKYLPLTVQGWLMLEIYQNIFNFVDSMTFDSNLNDLKDTISSYSEKLKAF